MTSSPWCFTGEFIPVFDPLKSGVTEFRPTCLNVQLSAAFFELLFGSWLAKMLCSTRCGYDSCHWHI